MPCSSPSSEQTLPDPAKAFLALREKFPVPAFREMPPYLLIYVRKVGAWAHSQGQNQQISLYLPVEQAIGVQRRVRR